ncbi:MAG: TonB-dependent receptor [Bacteroidota bacterium]
MYRLKFMMNQLFKLKSVLSLTVMLLCSSLATAQDYTISGYVKDAANGEALIGTAVLVKELNTGNITNVYGFYSITVPAGSYNIEFSYAGFNSVVKTVELTKNERIDIELEASQTELEEVLIKAKAENSNVKDVEMSVARLDIKTIQKMPALLGEVDVIKSIQLLPGVSTVGEGASGFNVRGGNVGQNLVLLDQAPVYNSSHLFGLFSVFNPDAVSDVKLYKGGIPAQYGGRISSILDVRMKEGNSKHFEGTGGVGLIFSRLAIEAPIAKDKASFIVAGRRSYIDVLAAPVLNDEQLYFYDLTAKANYKINDKNRIFLSGYWGRDVFQFDLNQGFSWGNQTATLRWNSLINDKIFFNLTGVYSNYDYEIAFADRADDSFNWESHIQTINLKPEFTYFLNNKNELSFGGDFVNYLFTPADAQAVSGGEGTDIGLDDQQGLESSIYIANKQEVSDKVSLEYGIRFSSFVYLGPTTIFNYGEAPLGERRPVIGAEEIEGTEVIEDFYNVEPRFSIRYQLNQSSSIKASYNRMAQYIHLLSNTTASVPLDIWTPSTNNIDPQIGDQYALGYFKNLKNNNYELSVEGYFRDTRNQIDYIDGADLLLNRFYEGEVLSGIGRAYGLEFLVKKNTGKINGWASYTLGRTELRVDGINNGDWYPTRFDQTHNLKAVGFYDLNKRITFSANFTLTSGTPATFPSSRYSIQGYTIPHSDNMARNDVRIPTYHRLDLSMTLYAKKNNRRGNRNFWVFSLYNLYARENPFSIYFNTSDGIPSPGSLATTEATQFSVLGTVLPSVSYNFKF